MDAATRDRLFGTGRGAGQLQGVFTPRGWGGAGGSERGSVLASFKGFGRDGRGRERGLDLMQRLGLISAEQRSVGGPVGGAAPFAAAEPTLPVAMLARTSDNPIYDGLFAQSLLARMRAAEPVMAVADDVVEHVVPHVPVGASFADAVDDTLRLITRLR